jgi:hypothetical protein
LCCLFIICLVGADPRPVVAAAAAIAAGIAASALASRTCLFIGVVAVVSHGECSRERSASPAPRGRSPSPAPRAYASLPLSLFVCVVCADAKMQRVARSQATQPVSGQGRRLGPLCACSLATFALSEYTTSSFSPNQVVCVGFGVMHSFTRANMSKVTSSKSDGISTQS